MHNLERLAYLLVIGILGVCVAWLRYSASGKVHWSDNQAERVKGAAVSIIDREDIAPRVQRGQDQEGDQVLPQEAEESQDLVEVPGYFYRHLVMATRLRVLNPATYEVNRNFLELLRATPAEQQHVLDLFEQTFQTLKDAESQSVTLVQDERGDRYHIPKLEEASQNFVQDLKDGCLSALGPVRGKVLAEALQGSLHWMDYGQSDYYLSFFQKEVEDGSTVDYFEVQSARGTQQIPAHPSSRIKEIRRRWDHIFPFADEES